MVRDLHGFHLRTRRSRVPQGERHHLRCARLLAAANKRTARTGRWHLSYRLGGTHADAQQWLAFADALDSEAKDACCNDQHQAYISLLRARDADKTVANRILGVDGPKAGDH